MGFEPFWPAVTGGGLVPHGGVHGQRQAQAGLAPLGQGIQLLGRQGGAAFGGEGRGGAHIAQRGGKPRTKPVAEGVRPFFTEEYQILAPGGQAFHRVGHQRGARIHQNALLQHIPTAQRRGALLHQAGQQPKKAGVAGLVVVKGKNAALVVQGGVQVLQKQLFLRRAGVEGQVHRGDVLAGGKAPAGQLGGQLPQGKVAAGALRPPDENGVFGAVALHAGDVGAAEGHAQLADERLLPQNGLIQGVGQAGEPGPHCGGVALGGVRRFLGQQPRPSPVPG